MKKETMNCKESKEGFYGPFGGMKGKGGWYNNIIIANIKEIILKTLNMLAYL